MATAATMARARNASGNNSLDINAAAAGWLARPEPPFATLVAGAGIEPADCAGARENARNCPVIVAHPVGSATLSVTKLSDVNL